MLVLALATLLLCQGQAGRWDHRRSYPRRSSPSPSTTTPPSTAPPFRSEWQHSVGDWTPPTGRCQIVPEYRRLAGGRVLSSNYIDYVKNMQVEDKTLLAPVVFEGAMVSRTNTYKSFYFVSFKVFRVLKGQIDHQLQGQVRLLFQTQGGRQRGLPPRRQGTCPPVPFNVKSGRKYLVFVRPTKSPGRYVAVSEPETARRKKLKAARQSLTCPQCVLAPTLRSAKNKKVKEGRRLRLKCKVTNKAFPPPTLSWYKDGALMEENSRVTIEKKKKRTSMVILTAAKRDAGVYRCQADNLVGSSSQTVRVTVRQAPPTPQHSASECPIKSYCLNGGSCLYYQSILELVCRCTEGFTGQRCQYKKAQFKYNPPLNRTTYNGCGLYGYDISQHCSAWREAPEEMTADQYQEWKLVQEQESELRQNKSRLSSELS